MTIDKKTCTLPRVPGKITNAKTIYLFRFWPTFCDVSRDWRNVASMFIEKRRHQIDAGWSKNSPEIDKVPTIGCGGKLLDCISDDAITVVAIAKYSTSAYAPVEVQVYDAKTFAPVRKLDVLDSLRSNDHFSVSNVKLGLNENFLVSFL